MPLSDFGFDTSCQSTAHCLVPPQFSGPRHIVLVVRCWGPNSSAIT